MAADDEEALAHDGEAEDVVVEPRRVPQRAPALRRGIPGGDPVARRPSRRAEGAADVDLAAELDERVPRAVEAAAEGRPLLPVPTGDVAGRGAARGRERAGDVEVAADSEHARDL